jgi:hypothetical protein
MWFRSNLTYEDRAGTYSIYGDTPAKHKYIGQPAASGLVFVLLIETNGPHDESNRERQANDPI